MTAEMAMYYSAMLQVGLGDNFYRVFDKALEEEEPLSDLTLSLCDCISDVNAVLHVLREYTLDYAVDEQVVRDLVLEDLRGRLLAGEMTRADVVGTLYRIVQNLDKFWEDPWIDCWDISHDLELYEDGFISEEAFIESFDAWWNEGKRLNVWELQCRWNEQNNKTTKMVFWKKLWNKIKKL